MLCVFLFVNYYVVYAIIDMFYVCLFDSAEMLVNLGIPWVIIGHSERRALLNESNEVSVMIV